jgi:regulation of enolase protein 1 (concanavalin A-like superfamily)
MKFEKKNLFWIREADRSDVTDDRITIYTQPKTDLWQRTYYGFQNDSAPVLQMKTSEKYFSFIVKTEFDSKARFDQCGIVVYLDSENWMKASIEYENEQYQRLGSVVTNHGYSDWATTDIDASVKSMWYRLSRRESDYCIECSTDGITFRQMRICHLWEGNEEISFGVYACSPVEGSFQAKFTNMQITECMWEAHKNNMGVHV